MKDLGVWTKHRAQMTYLVHHDTINFLAAKARYIILFHGIGGSTFYKKYIKRTIFIQILSFAFHGLWTILLDKEMELMMFCKAPVYAKTGTTSLRHFSQLED